MGSISRHKMLVLIQLRHVTCILGFLTTVSCCMEDECLGYPGSSTVTSYPPESIMLPWLGIPATRPCSPMRSSRYLPHWVISGEGRGWAERRRGIDQRCAGNCTILWPKHSKGFRAVTCQSNGEVHWVCNTIRIPLTRSNSHSLLLTLLPPFLLICDFGKQNTRRNGSKISVSLVCYWQIRSKSANCSCH